VADIDMSSSRCAGYVVVTLHGELDIGDATRFARALSAAAASGSPVIVDLAELALADCSSLGVLVYARQQALRAGGDLLLAAPEGPVLRLLSLTGLIGWLPVSASVEEAANGEGGPWHRAGRLVTRRSAKHGPGTVRLPRPEMTHRWPGRDRLPPAKCLQKGGYHHQRQRRVR
jgi:anti-sigma B factor antagonist